VGLINTPVYKIDSNSNLVKEYHDKKQVFVQRLSEDELVSLMMSAKDALNTKYNANMHIIDSRSLISNQLLMDTTMGFNTPSKVAKSHSEIAEEIIQGAKKETKSRADNRRGLLDTVASFVCVDRNNSYGEPEDSFACIAELINAYLKPKYKDINLSASDVAVLLTLLKVGRLAYNNKHMDSWLDTAGYAVCGADIASKTRKE